jgi:hypothetical protein
MLSSVLLLHPVPLFPCSCLQRHLYLHLTALRSFQSIRQMQCCRVGGLLAGILLLIAGLVSCAPCAMFANLWLSFMTVLSKLKLNYDRQPVCHSVLVSDTHFPWNFLDLLCGLVVRVLGYRSEGSGSLPGAAVGTRRTLLTRNMIILMFLVLISVRGRVNSMTGVFSVIS